MRDRERLFCQEYLIDLNAEAAAIRAGYAPKTAKDAAAWIHAEHPKKPKLREEVDRLMALRSRRLGITSDRVLAELAKVAFASMGDVVDMQTGSIRDDAAPEDVAAITKVKVRGGKKAEREYVIDKVMALKLIGQHIGMFDDRARAAEAAQGSVRRVAEIMARLDAEAAEACDGAQEHAGPEDGAAQGPEDGGGAGC